LGGGTRRVDYWE
jgi:pyruvate/2-oxoglutarate/acetoin dehydrogenase E1 component